MKKYDFSKAKRLIEENKTEIVTASLGMHEDWFWTSDTVFEDGEYKENLDNEDLQIGGIQGSSWATPTLCFEYEDSEQRMIPCYTGESERDSSPISIYELGPLSAPVQTNITPLEEE